MAEGLEDSENKYVKYNSVYHILDSKYFHHLIWHILLHFSSHSIRTKMYNSHITGIVKDIDDIIHINSIFTIFLNTILPIKNIRISIYAMSFFNFKNITTYTYRYQYHKIHKPRIQVCRYIALFMRPHYRYVRFQ